MTDYVMQLKLLDVLLECFRRDEEEAKENIRRMGDITGCSLNNDNDENRNKTDEEKGAE